MSTDVQEPEVEVTEATRKRTVLSLQDRIKVVDYLRSLPEPIIADSNNEIAAKVAEATKVAINWPQLKYMFEELPEMKLADKVHVKSLLSTDDQLQAAYERSVALEAAVKTQSESIASLVDSVQNLLGVTDSLRDRIIALEEKQ